MLLSHRPRRVPAPEREAGSALATVIMLLAATAVVATTLVTMTVFNVGHTSADRAGVQARAAAEAGLTWALDVLGDLETCHAGMFLADGTMAGAPSVPDFAVTLQHRSYTTPWTSVPRCPDLDVVTEIRVVSVGQAVDDGIRGHRSMDTASMEAVIALPRPLPNAVFAEDGATGSKTVDVETAPEDAAALEDDASAQNPFPRITATDSRFAEMQWTSWSAATTGVRTSMLCEIDQQWTLPLTLDRPTVIDSRTDCPGGLKVSKDFQILLKADLVLLVESYTQSSGTVTVRSGDGL